MHEGEHAIDKSYSSCTRRHSRTSFELKGILMKNNLSSERIIAALSAAKVGTVGVHVLGAAGGGPGALDVATVNACATSCSSSASHHNLASLSESQNFLSNSSFNSDNVGQ